MSPDTSGIDNYFCITLADFSAAGVLDFHAGYASAVFDESNDLVESQNFSPVQLCVDHIGNGKPERIDRTVGNSHRTDELGICGRLKPQGLFWVNGLSPYSCLGAGFDKSRLKRQIVFRQSNKKTIGLIDTMARNFAQGHILPDTLVCAFLIGNCIAGTAV